MYRSGGCSRVPVTVAVFSSSRSTTPGAFWPAALGVRATGWAPAAGLPAGDEPAAGAPAAGPEAPLDVPEAPPGARGEVGARRSPASVCSVAFGRSLSGAPRVWGGRGDRR